jgi:chemotaxis protein MotB
MARRKGGAHGGHGWFVTFADLMGLLLSFFVVVVASSTQEKEKMLAVAGSFREAFGTIEVSRSAGVIEVDGIPTRNAVKNVGTDLDSAAEVTTPEVDNANSPNAKMAMPGDGGTERLRTEMAIRQALQNEPSLADLSSQVIFEERPEGLAIEIVDQDGRSMFPDGSVSPSPRIVDALTIVAKQLSTLPNRISIAGHTASREGDGRILLDKAWELSTLRALKARDILANQGIATDRFKEVGGRGSTDPFFPDDPSLARNRRITLILHDAGSVLPAGHGP